MATRQAWALLYKRRRAQRDGMLPETVEVWRATVTADAAGGTTEVYARVATYPGRVEKVSETAALIAQRLGQTASAVIVMPHDITILTGDQLRVGTAVYSFVGSDAGQTDRITASVVVAEAR